MTTPGGAKTWFTAAELAELALPGVPRAKRKINELAAAQRWAFAADKAGQPLARSRQDRGGGVEYFYSVLPTRAVAELVRRGLLDDTGPVPAPETPAVSPLWAWFERQSSRVKAEARRRLTIVQDVEAIRRTGASRSEAIRRAAIEHGVSTASIWGWFRLIAGARASDRLPELAPRRQGGGREAEIDPEAWRLFKSDYLRPEGPPTLASCYARLKETWADPRGIALPHPKTFQRRVAREIPPLVVRRLREGAEKARRAVPALTRSVAHLHAMQAVNIDGHSWDVQAVWPDGEVGRPMMVMIQDLYSRKVLAWRIGRSESAALVQLTFKDLFKSWGIPEACYFDNGRAFASKWITGGAPTRFRGKVLESDPLGIVTALSIEVHWTTPYSGQSKPIERAFGDLEQHIGAHPAFAGAATGNNPLDKPENHRSRSVDIETFTHVVAAGIARHNARPNRRTETASGALSFDQVFQESYESSKITKATPAHLRMVAFPAEKVRVDRHSGAITLFGNTYWSEALLPYLGRELTARFDPEDLHGSIDVYELRSGAFVAAAPAWHPVGFNNAEAAQDQARLRARIRRDTGRLVDLQDRLSAAEVADAYATGASSEAALDPKIIEPAQFRRPRRGAGPGPAPERRRLLIDRLDLETIEAARAAGGGLRAVE